MTQTAESTRKKGIIGFLLSRKFLKNLLGIVLLFVISFIIATLWLKFYTKHGQQRELPDYQNMELAVAEKDAKEQKFRLEVTDSIHVVGEPGGKILQQNPEPFSKVKSGRTIYVTITKNEPDEIPASRLPSLYGENYDRKKTELAEHFEIRSKVVGKKYDPGVAGQILEVQYQGNVIIDRAGRRDNVMIEKGGLLEFVISQRSGGSVDIPNMICMQYAEAKFLLESIGLYVGDITYGGTVTELSEAYVIAQNPSNASKSIDRGAAVSLEVADEKPTTCE